jgi:hypothetical protein
VEFVSHAFQGNRSRPTGQAVGIHTRIADGPRSAQS